MPDCRVIVPYLRGFGTTRFLSDRTLRNGEQAVPALDTIALMDALELDSAILAGFDWGARTADICAALWPERCDGLVSVSGYLIGSQAAGMQPLPPAAELQWWYQYYFATERGRAGYDANRHDFAKLIWRTASPKWDFDDATFDRSAASFDNPDHVAITIHNYRWRLGLADGEAEYDEFEKRLAEAPVITVPTITLEGDANGAPHARSERVRGKVLGLLLAPDARGWDRPQPSPGGPGGLRRRGPRGRRNPPVTLLPGRGRRPDFGAAAGWLNSEPLTEADLQDKVVLTNFWTYTCINWLRTLAYVRAWAEKYAEPGLVVVGVHTPEFPFERDPGNVREAARAMHVDYAIALDPDYAVWDAFSNRYWPAVYIAGADGHIRHHQFGEGGYEECEQVIQELLREAGNAGVGDELVAVSPHGVEAQADWMHLESPETYVGYQQGRRFASPGGAGRDEPRDYAVPDPLPLNSWALDGTWTIEGRAAVLDRADGRIAFRFHARDVHLVLRAKEHGRPVPFRVLLDGAPPGADHGLDVDDEGHGTLVEPRLYQLIRRQGSIADRTFEIVFLEPGVEAYVFTFG